MLHFAANIQREWESSKHHLSSPQRALCTDENGGHHKLKPILLASFERWKKIIFYAKNLLLGRPTFREFCAIFSVEVASQDNVQFLLAVAHIGP